MAFVTKPEAFSISEIKSTIMDRIHMGGSFLQQSPTVTVGGMPVAIKQGGSLGSLGSALSDVTAAVQAAGDIAGLMQNPMSLVEGAVSSAVSSVSSQISGMSGQLTAGQISSLSSTMSGLNTSFSSFQAHTSNLSGLASSISDTIPDFKKLTDLGNNLTNLGSATRDNFVQNAASALYSDVKMNDIKDTLNVTVSEKIRLIKGQDANTVAGQTAISSYVTEITNLLNTQKNTMTNIVTSDTNYFNESGNTLTASTSVIGLADQYANTDSVSYTLLSRVGKSSTLSSFNTAIQTATVS
jgi:hypothetical protein